MKNESVQVTYVFFALLISLRIPAVVLTTDVPVRLIGLSLSECCDRAR